MKIISMMPCHIGYRSRGLKKGVDIQMKRMTMKRIMQPLRSLLKDLDRNLDGREQYKLVLEENLRHAFIGRYPLARIDYTRFILTWGRLPVPRDLMVTSSNPGQLQFSWKNNSGIRDAYDSDCLFIALFNRAIQQWYFELAAAERMTCQFEIQCNTFQGKKVHVYAGFVSVDNSRVSTSVWLGEVQIMGFESKASV